MIATLNVDGDFESFFTLNMEQYGLQAIKDADQGGAAFVKIILFFKANGKQYK